MITIDKTSTNEVNKLSSELESDLTLVFKVIENEFMKEIDENNFSEAKLIEILDRFFGESNGVT